LSPFVRTGQLRAPYAIHFAEQAENLFTQLLEVFFLIEVHFDLEMQIKTLHVAMIR